MTAKYTGGCLCGQVRYEIDADPIVGIECHCQHCQKRSGAGHAVFMAFPKAAAKITGPLKYHAAKADSGNMASRGFCTECGCPVAGGSTGMPEMIAVMVGSLDDPSVFKPQMLVYGKRLHGWDHHDPALTQFPGMPPM